jgi:hypothetical protein
MCLRSRGAQSSPIPALRDYEPQRPPVDQGVAVKALLVWTMPMTLRIAARAAMIEVDGIAAAPTTALDFLWHVGS